MIAVIAETETAVFKDKINKFTHKIWTLLDDTDTDILDWDKSLEQLKHQRKYLNNQF